MEQIHTTPQIIEVANFALLRSLIITLENKGLIDTKDIAAIGSIAIDMCSRTRNEDPASSLGAAQLIEHWISSTFGQTE